MVDADITLYRLQACPYCERVVRTLDALGLAYRSRFVEPMHSERTVVKRISGARTVPAIVDVTTGVTMSESANIVDYLERTYGDAVADGVVVETPEDAEGDDAGKAVAEKDDAGKAVAEKDDVERDGSGNGDRGEEVA